jgi:hypothetical protein
MALSLKAQSVLGSLKSLRARLKAGGGKVTSLVYTQNKQGMYHHVYKQGTNLVSQNKVIGKVQKGQKFVQAENGLALVKSISTNQYTKFLKPKGKLVSASSLSAIAKKIAQQKSIQRYKQYVSNPAHRLLRNANQRLKRAKASKING